MRTAAWVIAVLTLAAPALALDGSTAPHAAPDRNGGVFRLFSDAGGLWVWHLRGDGSPATGYATAQLVDSAHSATWGAIAADGFGGAVISYRVTAAPPAGVRTMRIASALAPAPGWPLHGALAATTPVGPGFHGLASDFAGGLYTAWQDFRTDFNDQDIVLQHLTSTATTAPAWPANGVFVCDAPGDQFDPVLAADPLGGAFAAWWDGRASGTGNDTGYDIWAQSIAVDGAMRWPIDGVPVTRRAGNQLDPSVTLDGQGGVLVAWVEHPPVSGAAGEGRLGVQRINSAGNPAPGWPTDGVMIGASATRSLLTTRPPVVADGEGGAYLFWVDGPAGNPPAGPYTARVQHVAPNGTVAPGWPLAGLALASSSQLLLPTGLLSDGQGGAIACWFDLAENANQLRVQRVRPTGTLAPGWPVNGVVVTESAEGPIADPVMVEDHAGGATLSWYGTFETWTTSVRPRVRRVTHEGVLDPYWADYPYADGQPVTSPMPSPGAVSITFALPTISSIEARVFDLSGRRVRDLARIAESPAGRRTLVWDGRDDDGEAVPAGLYFVRVRWAGRDHTARVIIAR